MGTIAKHLSKPCFTRYGRGIRYLGYLDDGEKITRGEGLDLQRSSGCRAPGVTSLMAALLRMINEYGWTLGPGGGTSRVIASRDSQPRRRRRYAPKAGARDPTIPAPWILLSNSSTQNPSLSTQSARALRPQHERVRAMGHEWSAG